VGTGVSLAYHGRWETGNPCPRPLSRDHPQNPSSPSRHRREGGLSSLGRVLWVGADRGFSSGNVSERRRKPLSLRCPTAFVGVNVPCACPYVRGSNLTRSSDTPNCNPQVPLVRCHKIEMLKNANFNVLY